MTTEQDRSTKIQDRLRGAAQKLRTTPISLADFIPLLLTAADEIERLRADAARKSDWNSRCRDVVDDLLRQAGYQEDSSARHNLAMMSFDAAMKESP